MDLKEKIGARIKELRTQNRITQDQLAERMNISAQYFSSIERGKENPTLNTLIRLSEALNVDLKEIFSFVDIQNTKNRKIMLNSLLEKADDEQLKLAYKVLSAILR